MSLIVSDVLISYDFLTNLTKSVFTAIESAANNRKAASGQRLCLTGQPPRYDRF